MSLKNSDESKLSQNLYNLTWLLNKVNTSDKTHLNHFLHAKTCSKTWLTQNSSRVGTNCFSKRNHTIYILKVSHSSDISGQVLGEKSKPNPTKERVSIFGSRVSGVGEGCFRDRFGSGCQVGSICLPHVNPRPPNTNTTRIPILN